MCSQTTNSLELSKRRALLEASDEEQLDSELEDLEAEQLQREQADFSLWLKSVSPTWSWDWAHLQFIREKLELVTSGECKRLALFLPPRHGKSEQVTVRYPVWRLEKTPELKVIIGAYNQTLAESFSRKARRIALTRFDLSVERATAGEWETAVGGGMRAVGVGAGVTGHGGDCFPAGTQVTTSIGDVDIERLVRMRCRPLVLAFNHTSGKLEWRQIEAVRERWSDNLVRITTESGRVIDTTASHLFYTQGGYAEAQVLGRSAKLVTAEDVPGLRRSETAGKQGLCPMLQQHSQRADCANLSVVREAIPQNTLHGREGGTTRPRESLLFKGMLGCTQRSGECQEMCTLWRSNARAKGKQVLFDRMQRGSTPQETAQGVPAMWGGVYPAIVQNEVLFSGMRGHGALNAYDWHRELPLQGWDELCAVVSGDAPVDYAARQLQMRGVRGMAQTCDSSHRREPRQQHRREPCDTVLGVPLVAPQIGTDAVSVVSRIRGERIKVYDIQIEECHNFFANEVLVHNCIIIDDPVKNREEANSEVYRDHVWDWYRDDLYTRLEPDGSIVLIMTRWHEDDLAGRILNSENAGDWTVISLPAEAEANDQLGREIGAALCPERFDLDALADIKTTMGRSYWALYQQAPQPQSGEFFKRDWFTIETPSANLDGAVRYWDKAASADGGDYTAGVLIGRKGRLYYVMDVVRGQWSTFEREEIILKTAHRDLQRIGPSLRIWVEQEPGSSGKDSSQMTIARLAGFTVRAERPTGDKATRAEPFAAQCEAGFVRMVKATWNDSYLDELCGFPFGKYDDQVDASSGAFNNLVGKGQTFVFNY